MKPNDAVARSTRWHVVPTRDALQAEALARVSSAAQDACAHRSRFRIVLAGGETPRDVYRRLVALETQWAHWEVYFGDERCVPRGDAERNDRMAFDAWLDHVAIPRDAIHVVPAEQGPAAGAEAYRRTLAGVADFDLVLLGLGEDGHTASLFPGAHERGEAADAPDALPVFDAPKPPPERVSMSAARLGRARGVLFLVAGESKRDAVRRWRAGEDLPASSIRCATGVDVLVESVAFG
ncbi:MAG: 6-phosphogluconolactonase [Burkholderiaceae bacterium]|nr:6-phosphogluconolactonase [Burkholderiaceae bacterium]